MLKKQTITNTTEETMGGKNKDIAVVLSQKLGEGRNLLLK